MHVNYSECAKRDPDTRIQFPADKGNNGLDLRIRLGKVILKRYTYNWINDGRRSWYLLRDYKNRKQFQLKFGLKLGSIIDINPQKGRCTTRKRCFLVRSSKSRITFKPSFSSRACETSEVQNIPLQAKII